MKPKPIVTIPADQLDALSDRLALATADVRDLRGRLAFEQKRQIERGREILVERAMLNANIDNGQTLA